MPALELGHARRGPRRRTGRATRRRPSRSWPGRPPSGSASIVPLNGLGPLFVSVIVYVVVPPADTEATPSVVLAARSDDDRGGLDPGHAARGVVVGVDVIGVADGRGVGDARDRRRRGVDGHGDVGKAGPGRQAASRGHGAGHGRAAVPQFQPDPAADTRSSPAGAVSVTVMTPPMFPLPTFRTASV